MKARPTAHTAALRATALAAGNPDTRPTENSQRYTVSGVETMLLGMKNRLAARVVQGSSAIGEWITQALEDINTDDWLKGKSEQVIAASNGDREAQSLHAAGVLTTTENFVRANSNWLPFFEEKSLADDEYPMMQVERPGMQASFDTIGQDGGRQTIQAQIDTGLPTAIPIWMRATAWIEYPLVDAYKGPMVKELALSQFDVARDRLDRTESLLASYLLVTGASTRLAASFVTTGDLSLRDYYVNARVNTANMPAGNLITLSGNSTTTLFRKEVFDAIMEYCMSWGVGALGGGDLAPAELVVASSHATAFFKQVAITSTTNSVIEQIFDGGFIVNYGPYKWSVVYDNTIDPNQGVCYVRTNKPIGTFFSKPGLSRTIVDENANLTAQNKGRVCETWAEAFGMPRHWRKNTLGVCYKTAS